MPFFRKHYIGILIYVLVFLISVSLVVIAVIPPSPFAVLGVKTIAPTPTIQETKSLTSKDIIDAINKSRTENRLNSLSVNFQLTQAANEKIFDMVEKKYF